MRTNIVLDEKLVKTGMKLTKAKSKRELVDTALREYVAQQERRAAFKQLFGSGGIDLAYDYKASRK